MTFTFGGNNRQLKTNRSKQEFQDAKKISLQHPLTFAMTLLYDLEEHYQRILFPKLVPIPMALKILPTFLHLQEATLSALLMSMHETPS
jgi:hypothetical protein